MKDAILASVTNVREVEREVVLALKVALRVVEREEAKNADNVALADNIYDWSEDKSDKKTNEATIEEETEDNELTARQEDAQTESGEGES